MKPQAYCKRADFFYCLFETKELQFRCRVTANPQVRRAFANAPAYRPQDSQGERCPLRGLKKGILGKHAYI